MARGMHTDPRPCASRQVGDVVEGIVESIRPFGAFINLGETNGLLHISQISHERVNAVENVLTPGDRLKVCCPPSPLSFLLKTQPN